MIRHECRAQIYASYAQAQQVQTLETRSDSLSARFQQALRSYLGTPYVEFCLGEGDTGVFDADPRFDFSRVDCVTLIEQCLAEAVAGGRGAEFLPALDRIRYAEGKVGFLTRNHFFVADWIPANNWVVEDVTSKISGVPARTITRAVGKQKFFRPYLKDETDSLVADLIDYRATCIPSAQAATAVKGLNGPHIVSFIGDKPDWVFSLHVGVILPPDSTESVTLIHASSEKKMVMEEDFLAYLQKHPHFTGFKLLKIRE